MIKHKNLHTKLQSPDPSFKKHGKSHGKLFHKIFWANFVKKDSFLAKNINKYCPNTPKKGIHTLQKEFVVLKVKILTGTKNTFFAIYFLS